MLTRIFFSVLMVFFVFTSNVPSLMADSKPVLNNGKKWRIGYYEGGPYSDYTDTMRPLVKALIEAGWIKDSPPPDYFREMPKPYWEWLTQCESPYLSFKSEDAYSAGWDNSNRSIQREELLGKLKSDSLDLVIAMGTWAGLDLANNDHTVPVMVLSTSNPVRAGIIKSSDNSGYEHVTARVDPGRYSRQVRMFHRIIGFETLGLAYENTPDGLVYSAVEEVGRIAQKRGFKVSSCEVIDSDSDTEKSDESCLACYRELAQRSDAVYVTALTCVDRLSTEIAEIFRKARTPSFAMVSSKFVKDGMLLSLSNDSGYAELGKYNAMKFGEILNGTKPVKLKQLFQDPLDVAVNMETARQIGFIVPVSILKIATEIYEE